MASRISSCGTWDLKFICIFHCAGSLLLLHRWWLRVLHSGGVQGQPSLLVRGEAPPGQPHPGLTQLTHLTQPHTASHTTASSLCCWPSGASRRGETGRRDGLGSSSTTFQNRQLEPWYLLRAVGGVGMFLMPLSIHIFTIWDGFWPPHLTGGSETPSRLAALKSCDVSETCGASFLSTGPSCPGASSSPRPQPSPCSGVLKP